MGRLHETLLGADGAGEGALLVPEELGFEQLLGQRGAVHRDEGVRHSRAIGVDGARDQLLARAGLSDHQDIGLGARGLAHQLEDSAHGRAPADDVVEPEGLGELLLETAVLALQAPVAEGPIHGHAQLVHREVLRQIVEGPFLDRGHRRLDGGESRDHDHGQGGVQFMSAVQQLHAIDAGHLQICEDHVGMLALEQLQRSAGVGGDEALVPRRLQNASTVLHHVRFVVYDEHAHVAHDRTSLPTAGKVRTKIVPFPGSDSTSIVPLCSRTMLYEMDSPSPVPSDLVV